MTEQIKVLGEKVKAAMRSSLMSNKVEAEQSLNVDTLVRLASEPTVTELIDLLSRLSDDQRCEIINNFCVHCGNVDIKCFCKRDD